MADPSDGPVAVAKPMELDATTSDGNESVSDLYTKMKLLQRQLEFLEIQVRASRRKGRAWKGGVHQGRAKEPQKRASACPRRGEEDPVRSARDRTVPRDGGHQQRDHRLDHRLQLLRQDPQHAEPRAAETLVVSGLAPSLQRPRGHIASRGRLKHLAHDGLRETRRHVFGTILERAWWTMNGDTPNGLLTLPRNCFDRLSPTQDIGGNDIQKQEIREAVELPLTQFELYRQIGIDPPRGVLLYGPPGTGKTMLAKAVAHHTTASFLRVVGSEFVQKYLGEGPRMVRDVFRLAKENAPAIIFIDEIDAIATARFDAQTGADREVQRILMELLNQMDGFDQTVNVKVIMATNRADTLDPALLRPGRLDRKIEFPLPDRRQKRLVFQVCTSKMNLSDEVDLEDYVSRSDKITAADIAAICQEAGLQAVRKNRYVVLPKDFEKGYKANVKKSSDDFDFYK
eukprot:scaffold938_cov334-Pavlova_lutheri.AAC.14